MKLNKIAVFESYPIHPHTKLRLDRNMSLFCGWYFSVSSVQSSLASSTSCSSSGQSSHALSNVFFALLLRSKT